MRPLDEPIPESELLFRSISVDDVLGQDILPSAVELPRCSFNREKYSSPEDVLVEERPGDNGIVSISVLTLPGLVPRESGEPYEFFTQDDPVAGNDAHAEVRLRRLGHPFNKNHKVNKLVLAKAKDQLVRCLAIYRVPQP